LIIKLVKSTLNFEEEKKAELLLHI
jgi:hypothetical protein